MTYLTPNHPAVEAAHSATDAWMDDLQHRLPNDQMVHVLTTAIPHLTADDLPARLVRDIQVRTIRATARAAAQEEWAAAPPKDRATVSAWLNELADNIERDDTA